MRKNSERIALESGENVRSLQYFIGQSRWKLEPAIKIHLGSVTNSSVDFTVTQNDFASLERVLKKNGIPSKDLQGLR